MPFDRFNRIAGWLRLAGPSGVPLLRQGHPELLAQGRVQVALEDFQGGRPHSLGNLCPCSITCTAP